MTMLSNFILNINFSISAPLVPILTLAIPQSEPEYDKNRSLSCKWLENIVDDNPCFTPFCISMAFSHFLLPSRLARQVETVEL